MAFSYSVLILQRGVLPLILVSAAMFRPVGISFVYLLMFFISPFIPVATAQNFRGSVTAYWIILIALSTILLLCHVALQITLLIFEMKDFVDTCSFAVILVQHIGFVDLTIETLSIIQWVAPEVVVFLSAVVIYIIIKKLTSASGAAGQAENGEVGAPEDANVDNPVTSRARKIPRSIINKINFEPLVEVAPMFSLGTLFLASVLRPSVPGGFYFLIFLLSGTYWATFQTLQRGFAIMIRLVMVVLVVHTLTIISYQTSWMQEHINNETLVARLIGLEPLIHTECEGGDVELLFNLSSFKFDSFLNPFAMLFSYYVLALTSKNLIEKRIVSKPLSAFGQLENGTKNNRQFSLSTRTTNSNKKDSWSRSQRLNLVRHKKIVRSIETSVEARKAENDIPMDVLDDGFEGEKDPSVFEQIAYGIVSVGGFIYQNSYIFTNILMMAWSIVYHSWLTFVFLLWANVLWMIPNQRKAMMRSSPLIVFYAELLLIAQYIYGMNLTNDELPSSVNITGINLQQIGLERPSEHNVQPCIPLIVKASFLLMFWVTLRQFFKEKNEKKKHTTLSDMVAPLQVSVGAATAGGDGSSPEHKKTSKFLKKAGDIIKNLLVRLWIWLLILVIFLCAITGDKMTGFRICYMAMFLFFLLVFQSSSQLWVKIMYGFWLFLIFYAMSILTLVYTYQFDKFDIYWHQYLNISKTIQEDIGLKKYETKDLFLHLLSPTIIVILTVIQVHYFHRRFIASLQNQPIGHHQSHFAHKKRRKSMDQDGHSVDRASMAKDRASLAKDRASMAKDRASLATELEASGMTTQINDLMKRFLSEFKNRFKRLATTFKGTCWRFLEMQLINGVYIAAFISCVSEVCVLHIIFCGLCIIGLISKKKMQVFLSRIISLAVSIIILTKMVYQVQYISHERYDINCVNNDSVKNTAVWFGLQKASDYGGLLHLIKKYIIFIVMVTLHGVVTLRQKQMHTLRGEPHKQPPKLLFPGITRADAEKNLSGMIKYLFNYGFYKFGLEITFIALVCLITFRQDVVAIMYVIWLCVLLWMERSWMARIWGVFQCFTASLIFLEYVLLVGLPPGLCSEYPWTKSVHSHALQKWSMLPGNLEYSHVNKLIFDFIVLLFINRQKRAFSKENKHESDPNYPGGSNKSVINDIENLGRVEFENPTRDFLATVRNYLDVIKNIVFCGFYWITLAVIFLAGTNISDSLALGYLIGSFIFLWQGSDFYLRPIRVILNRWNALLMYNVLNITTKTVFQIAGCLFLNYFQTHACWLIHLLGIECAEGSDLMLTADTDESTSECPKLQSKSFLFWDTACFAFIIIQMRIFRSHYFCHIINETKANALLADRGAGIIEDLRQKQIEHRKKHEQEILRKIKRKMEKIRATQQKTLRHIERPTHFDANTEGTRPLLHSGSFSSCEGSGYHTPVHEDEIIQNTGQTDKNLNVPSIIGGGGRLMPYMPGDNNRQPSASSAGMTISFDGFLDTKRMSFDSTVGSEFLPKPSPSSEGSYGVFSPPLTIDKEANSKGVDTKDTGIEENRLPMSNLLPPPSTMQTSLIVNISGASSVISSIPNSRNREARRQSSVNAVSWNEPVSETWKGKDDDASKKAIDNAEDVPVTLRQKSLHRRHLSMGNATYSMEDSNNNRHHRYSNLSAPDEPLSQRPNSWGPVDFLYSESITIDVSRATSHAESIRAGDYYMFEHMDEKFELDLIEDEVDFLDDPSKIDETERKMTRRKNLFEVCKEITSKRKIPFTRQRSYASAPGSRIGIKEGMEPDVPRSSVISDPLVYPESCDGDDHDTHDTHDKPKQTKPKDEVPSTSKDASMEEHESETESEDLEPPNPILRLLEAFMVSVVIRLNRFSRNYRYVMKILSAEKKALKESKPFEIGGSALNVLETQKQLQTQTQTKTQAPTPTPLKNLSDDDASKTIAQITQSDTDTELHDTNTTTTTAAIHEPLIDINAIETDTVDGRASSDSGASQKDKKRRSSGVPDIRVMPPSVEMGLDETGTLSDEWSSKSDRSGALTYEEDFASRDHHIVVEVIISAWYAIVANTDVVCYIVVFVNQVVNASIISLPLPLMVFLWGSLSLPRPTKNFWVTLIAYTQALVFIKTFCDFKLLWTHYTNTQNPLDARSIIGLATGEHIATYDLLLLLVLFFHRFILKIQGLWKSQYLIVVEENAMVFKEDKTKRFPYEFSETPSRESPEAGTGTGTGTGTERNSVIAGPKISKMTEQYKSCGRQFFIDLMKKTRLPTDVYALMFLCDFVNFFVLLFGFTAFGNQQGDDGVQTYLLENKVPVPFLIMLLVQFILIVIDRALYLRKALFQKICFHFFSVIGIHVWMFFIIPAVTERNFNSLTPPVMFYIIKCFYLLFSSYQIKCGYPKRILGNFLTKGFSLVNMISFKVYMQVPFLFELRTVLDWVCTDTTMTLFDWLKMEDIFSEIYFIKCSRQMESDFPALRAQKKPMLTKIALGGTAILLIVIMIWGPLCLFALGNAVGQPNIAYEVQTSIRIGHFDPIYDTINRENIFPFDSAMFERLKDTYSKKRGATRFFSNYDETDIAAITMQPDAPSSWAITPPDKARLLRDLIKHKSLPCSFTYSLSRDPPIKGGVGTVSDEITINLSGNFSGREDMIAMLQGKGTSDSFVVIPNIIPKFIKVHNSGELTVIKQLMPENQEYRSLVIRLQSDNSSFAVWWEVQEDCDDSFYRKVLSRLPYASCDEVVMYTFNDKKFPSTFSFATAGGIIGLYTTFVLLASRFLKSSLSGQSRRVMYEDLPYVDRVLQLCLDIYLVREALELALEEDLFAKLLFLYRSPETMIKWTRHKEESIEDETDTESGRSSQRRQ